MKPRQPKDKKKVTAAGRKLKLAGTDPIFQQIWKSANKELKRYIFFIDPFTNPEDYDLLPQQVYKRATTLVGRLGYRYVEDLEAWARKEYSPEWSSGVSHQSPPLAVISIYTFTAIPQIECTACLAEVSHSYRGKHILHKTGSQPPKVSF